MFLNTLAKFFSRKTENHVGPKRNLVNSLLAAELCMALEERSIFPFMIAHPNADLLEVATALGLKIELLRPACEFLSAEGLLSKVNKDSFRLVDYKTLQISINYLLAYKTVFESFGPLIDGSKVYGKDIERDAKWLGTATRYAIPYLVRRLIELGYKNVLDLGCGTGNFLLSLAASIPNFQGMGIEIDQPTIEKARKRIQNSPYKDSIKIFDGDASRPDLFPTETKNVEALIGAALFHEFNKEDKLPVVLEQYKKYFPRSKLFLIELDTPGWNELQSMPHISRRGTAAQYRLIHYFSNQGLPQSKKQWLHTLQKTRWHVTQIQETPQLPILIFECD